MSRRQETLILPLFCVVQHADALMKSKEMAALLSSSRNVALSAGGLVVHVACLPVTIPLHVLSSTRDLVGGVTHHVVKTICFDSSAGVSTSSRSPIDGLVDHVIHLVPCLIQAAGRITQGLGGTALQIVAPVLGLENGDNNASGSKSHKTSSGQSSAEYDSFLDRLRIDIPSADIPSKDVPVIQSSKNKRVGDDQPGISQSEASPSDVSKYLLRVDDLHVYLPADPVENGRTRVLYIDLGKEFSDQKLTKQALKRLAKLGVEVVSTNPHVNLSSHISGSVRVEWKPEGNTARTLRKMKLWSEEECSKRMENEILVWSGKYLGANHYGSENPVFLARGTLKMRPRDFLNLLWDSSRTSEYNNYCMGRSDVMVLEDNILKGGSFGAKIIRSETKVPFTGLSVMLTVLMHARALEGEEGFIIVSRTLDSGMAGYHLGNSSKVEKANKNEILLGVNLIRPAKDNSEYTDLTSMSQVGSSLVPLFLAKRIGMMGIEDFFNNVRHPAFNKK